MIKIIKRGTRKIATCENCGCKFSYEQEDVIADLSQTWTALRTNSEPLAVKCPQCGKAVALEAAR